MAELIVTRATQVSTAFAVVVSVTSHTDVVLYAGIHRFITVLGPFG